MVDVLLVVVVLVELLLVLLCDDFVMCWYIDVYLC